VTECEEGKRGGRLECGLRWE
jgi:hypothetical protein